MNAARALCLLLGLLSAVPSAAVVIDVNAGDEYWSYHYAPIPFEAGTYRVTPIGRDTGGLFNAWIAWGAGQLGGGDIAGCSLDGLCDKGWLNSYSFGYIGPNDFVYEIATVGGRVDQGTVQAYASPELALVNAQSFDFTLATQTYLYFYLRDFESTSAYADNGGGMSLLIEQVAQVPEPSNTLLMVCGLIAIGYAVRMAPKNASHNI
jgi:hypothetical protein